MKRNVMLLAVFSVMAACLSGCILSTTPPTTNTISLNVTDHQTFTVKGFMNGTYTWYKNDQAISGASGTSYTYTAVAEDAGQFSIKVVTKDLLSQKTLSKVWLVKVVVNQPPVAVISSLVTDVLPGTVINLDGSTSFDPEGASVTYLWEMVSKPPTSSAVLTDPYSSISSFTADVEGSYTVRLIVNDGTNNSAPVAVTIKAYTSSEPPTVEAGPDQIAKYGSIVQLDGSGSSDPQGHTLTYLWTIESHPTDSTAVLSDATSMQPTFTPDKSGQYVVSLKVNNGLFDSGIDYVTINVVNTKPVANAGTDIPIENLGGMAQLDGSGSSDPDGNNLTYKWTITSAPNGSTATITNPTAVQPTFTPDMKGAYLIALQVSDGELVDVDTVTVTVTNHVPVANAGGDITIAFGNMVQLDGSASSDPDGDTLTYAWSETDKPAGSTAMLSSTTIAKPTFTPDKKGNYTFQLIVTDTGGVSSAPDSVTIYITNNAPVANAGGDINLLFPGSKQLTGSGTDKDGDQLTYAWTISSVPTGSISAVLANANTQTPTFTPDVKGDYGITLVVNDGSANSSPSTITIHVYNTAPVPSVSNTSVLYGTTATLDGSGSYDPDETEITYTWLETSKPSGSTATLSSTVVAKPTFKPDKEGTYTFQLTVSDGDLSTSATLTLTTFNYSLNFENGYGLWSTPSATGNVFTYGITNDRKHGGSYSFLGGATDCYAGCSNDLSLSLTLDKPTYIYSVSCYVNKAFWSGLVDSGFYVDGTNISGTKGLDTGTTLDTWVYKSWTLNRVVNSEISFHWSNFFHNDNLYIDDIVVNTWGS